jgi:hypothetical protein
MAGEHPVTSPVDQELTVWRIIGLPGVHVNMDVALTVNTDSPIVVAALEKACEEWGIRLEPGGQERLW